MSDTLIRENEYYEIHVTHDPNFVNHHTERCPEDGVYHVISKETGAVEAKAIALPQAIFTADQYQQFLLDHDITNEENTETDEAANDSENVVSMFDRE